MFSPPNSLQAFRGAGLDPFRANKQNVMAQAVLGDSRKAGQSCKFIWFLYFNPV